MTKASPDRFHVQLKEFVQAFLHTTDSSVVQQELGKIWPNKTHGISQQLSIKLEYGKVYLPAISCVKYIARRHGLPKRIVESILGLLEPTKNSSNFLKYQSVQTLKYALEHEESVLDFIQLLNAIRHVFRSISSGQDDSGGNAGNLDDSYVKATLSQLVECVSIKLSPDNCHFDHNAEKKPINENWILSQIRPYMNSIDSRSKNMFLEKLENLGIQTRVGIGSSITNVNSPAVSEMTELDLDVETKGRAKIKPVSTGTEVLGRCSQSSKKGGELKADAVKTQQTVTSVYKENVSEKTEIENISLANALNSCRSTGREKEVASESRPALKSNKGDSVRSYFRTTAAEIVVLTDIANNPNDSICQDDMDYLRDKLTAWKWRVFDTNTNMNMSIVTIFSLVSQRQEINNSIQNALVKFGFASGSEAPENCRLKILKTIQICADRNEGKIPSEAEQYLLNFRKSDECTEDIKKALWKIFKKNDNNLFAAFEIALEDIKFRSKELEKEKLDEILDYIREQICDEERALNLEKKFAFVQDFLEIIAGKVYTNPDEPQAEAESGIYSYIPEASTVVRVVTDATMFGAYSMISSFLSGPPEEQKTVVKINDAFRTFIRAKLAQIMHDFIGHPKTPKLNSDQLKNVSQLYNDVEANSAVWSDKDLNMFKSSIIGWILETLNSPDFDFPNLSFELLDMLVKVSLDESNPKLGTLTLIALGNLVIENPKVVIPEPFRLHPRLLQTDGIDEEGLVYPDKHEEQVQGIKYCSAVTAHILLQTLKMQDFDIFDIDLSVFELIAQALTENKDKNTRILCAELFFHASQKDTLFPTDILWSLQSMTLDVVPDIRIHCTAAYCTSAARVLEAVELELTHFRLSSNDLDEIANLFALDKLVLGTQDFTKIVNEAILKILEDSADKLKFTHQVFQLLATLLAPTQNPDLKSCELILKIILDQMQTNGTGLPDYIMDALEDLFMRESKVFLNCVKIFVTVSEKYGQELSRAVLDILYKNLETSETPSLILKALLIAMSVQDLPHHIFRRFDLEFACERFLANLEDGKNSNPSTDEFEMEKYFSPKKTDNFRSNLLKCVKEYFAQGMRVTKINFDLFKASLQHGLNMEMTLQCIANAAENGQILPKDIIDLVLNPKLNTGIQHRLALALVQNNQTLPEEFQNTVILPRFLKQPFSKIFETDGEGEDARIFSIVTKSLQNTQKLGNLSGIVSKLCTGWAKEAGGNQRQRLEILTSLSSLVNCGEDLGDLDGTELKIVFIEALKDTNSQILEIGLHGFIALNTRVHLSSKLILYEPADVQLLVRIQRNEASNESVKNSIAEFLELKKKELGGDLNACINLSNLENKTNSDFIKDFQAMKLRKLKNNDFFETKACQNRIKEILESESDFDILQSTIQIVLDAGSKTMPLETLEAISLALVNHSDMPEFQATCQNVLDASIDLGLPFSPKIVQYLEIDSQLNSKLLLKLMSKSSTQLSLTKELQAALKIEQLIESGKIKESALDKIINELGYPILERPLFNQLLSADCIKPGVSLKIVQLIAINIQAFVPVSSKEQITKLVKILEHCLIKNEAKVQDSILEAFITFFSEIRKLEKPKETVLALLNIWNDSKKMTLERQCIILQSFVEIFKNLTFSKPYVKPKVVSLLIELTKNPISVIRKLSIRTLHHLQPGSLKSDKESLDVESIQAQVDSMFRTIREYAFDEVFKGESLERIEEEQNRDPEFTEELTEFLMGLTFLDFERLREVRDDRSQWKRLLILSDFLGTAIQSIDEQVEFFNFAMKFYEKAKNDSEAQDLFACLSLRLQDLPRTSIASLFRSLLTMDAEEMEVLKKPSKILLKEVAEIVVAKSIQNKLQFQLNLKLTKTLAYRLVLILGPELAQDVVQNLVSIESIDALDSFLNIFLVFENVNLVKLRNQLKPVLKDIQKVTDLKIVVESQILLTPIPITECRRPRIERIITALLRNGIQAKDIFKMMSITVVKAQGKSRIKYDQAMKTFEHALSQSSQYRVNAFFFCQLVAALAESGKSTEFISIINTLFRDGVFDGKSGVKDIHQVLNEFRIHNSRVSFKWSSLRERFVKAGYQWYLLKIRILQIVNGDAKSRIMHYWDKPISDWTTDQILEWSMQAKSTLKTMEPHDFYTEALAVCVTAIKLHRNFNLTKVQVLSCYVALHKLEKDKLKGQLQQVATGSGKSAIIAILAVVRALEGKKVDIYTSSPVLAERDSKEWEPFYQLFGFQAAHNGDVGSCYISGSKACYPKTIVYGDCSQFQFDYLRDKYSALGTLAGRTLDFAIVDEVDSMMLDDSSKLARLSTTLPGMDLIQLMYHFIWERLTYLQSHLYAIKGHSFYLEGQVDQYGVYKVAEEKTHELMTIKDLATFIYTHTQEELAKARIFPVKDIEEFVSKQLSKYIESLITDKSVGIKVPKHLQAFVKAQAPFWVESVLTAVSFQEDVHYVVSDKTIKPVDYRTTGIVQSSTNWNNGLHQFLGLKHSLKINSETVTTNFLSNMSMLSKYGSNLTGFTGTLGSQAGRELLYRVYNVKLLTLPETNFKRYIQFPDILVPNAEQWFKEIVISCMAERSKGRGVLIICETIQAATAISSVLSSLKVKVKLYTKNEEDQEKHIEKIHPGDIIVATNLAGRGTDINTNEIEDNGGLHVCLTFLPHSSRIEEQAFGRTSRQGRKGTGQLIIIEEPDVVDMKAERDSKESASLTSFETNQLPPIRTKGKVFEQFCSYFGKIRSRIREEYNYQSGLVTGVIWDTLGNWIPPSLYETLVLQSIEERWAMFLRRVEDEEMDEEATLKAYQLLEEEIETQFKEGGGLEVLKKGENAFYFMQLGNREYQQEKLEKAQEYYKMALDVDPDFGVGAQIGLGAILLKNSTSPNYKETALERFGNAQAFLHTEMATITVMQNLTQKKLPPDDDLHSPLLEQLMEKASLLGQLINAVEGNIGAVEKSLRRVHLSGLKDQRLEQVTLPNAITEAVGNQRELHSAHKNFADYSISFHNLTFFKDMGTKDQAMDTIPDGSWLKFKRGTKCKIGLRCKSTDLKALLENKDDVKLLKEVPELTIELHGIQVEPAQRQFLFNFDALKVTPKSFNLEFTGTAKIVQDVSLVLCRAGLLNQKDFVLKSVNDSEDGKAPVTVSETITTKSLVDSLEEKITQTSNLVSITLLRISQNEIEEVVKSLPQTNVSQPAVNLSLNSITCDKDEDLIKTWENLLSRYKNTIHLKEMSPKSAKKVIPLLRQVNSTFILDIYDLDLESVTKVLQNAAIVQEDMEQTKVQELAELFMSGRLPYQEIRELSARGLSILILFNEKRFIPWISICTVCAMATVQVAAGGILISTGFGASLGMSLITEGMSDFKTAYSAYSSRQFDWGDYAVQKAVSMLISVTTLGVNNMRNGAMGVQQVFCGTGLTSQASTAALSGTGMNLSILAVEYVGVKALETCGRTVVKGVLDKLTGFCFEQLRGSIMAEVSSRISTEFAKTDLNRELSRKWVIQKYLGSNSKSGAESRLQKLVESAARASMNPSAYKSFWDSVGSPLANNFLSDPSLVGTWSNTILLTFGAIVGAYEISMASTKVCSSVEEKLRDEPDPIINILTKAQISPDTINRIAKELKFKSEDYNGFLPKEMPDVSKFESEKEFKVFQDLLKKLHKNQEKFDSENSERSRIEKSVVDMVTNQIIRVANSHLVSPLMSNVASSLVKGISEDLQGRFLVDSKMGESKTIVGLINENAKEHMKIHQQMERIEVLDRMRTEFESGGDSGIPPSEEVKKLYNDVVGDAPLGSDMITAMAKNNNLDIKIVSDPKYQLTDEEKARGVRIVVYEPPPLGSTEGTPGHFNLRNENGEGYVDITPGEGDKGSNNCGVNIVSHLLAEQGETKSPQDLRLELGQQIVDNPADAKVLVDNTKWFGRNHGAAATDILQIGGSSKRRKTSTAGETPTTGRREGKVTATVSDEVEVTDEKGETTYVTKKTHTIPTNVGPGEATNQTADTAAEARELKKITGRSQVQKHDVNKDFGGGSNKENITVGTQGSNMHMKKIDEEVKAVLDKHRNDEKIGKLIIDQKITRVDRVYDGNTVREVQEERFTYSAKGGTQSFRDDVAKLAEKSYFRETSRGATGRLYSEVDGNKAYVPQDSDIEALTSETNQDFESQEDYLLLRTPDSESEIYPSQNVDWRTEFCRIA